MIINRDFPRIITLLRKEKGISQKQVSTDLKISQALLSHYEKGIRECGLDFVVKVANYYNVSCDYLLGRSPEISGNTISLSDLPPDDDINQILEERENAVTVLNKKIIINSLNILFDLVDKSGSKVFVCETSTFFMLAVYRIFRIVYSISPKNQQQFFDIPKSIANTKALSKMINCEMNLNAIARRENIEGLELIEDEEMLTLNSEMLVNEYPMLSSSLFNLIKNSENELNKFGP